MSPASPAAEARLPFIPDAALVCAGCGLTQLRRAQSTKFTDALEAVRQDPRLDPDRMVGRRPWAMVPRGQVDPLDIDLVFGATYEGPLALCGTCGPTDAAVHAWPLPRPCVAPTWPEWASTEDGDVFWVRADRVAEAGHLLNTDVGCEPGRVEPVGEIAMVWDRDLHPWHDWDWVLSVAHPEADEAVLYVQFDVVEL